jgi:hypothetical protein
MKILLQIRLPAWWCTLPEQKNSTLELIIYLNRFLSFETLDMGQLKKYVKAPRPGAGTSPLVQSLEQLQQNPNKRQRLVEPESQSTSQPGPSGVYNAH